MEFDLAIPPAQTFDSYENLEAAVQEFAEEHSYAVVVGQSHRKHTVQRLNIPSSSHSAKRLQLTDGRTYLSIERKRQLSAVPDLLHVHAPNGFGVVMLNHLTPLSQPNNHYQQCTPSNPPHRPLSSDIHS